MREREKYKQRQRGNEQQGRRSDIQKEEIKPENEKDAPRGLSCELWGK